MSQRVRHPILVAATVALASLPRVATAQSTALDTLAIEHATVLPMDRDTALADHTVLVWQDRIVWVGPSRDARISRRARRIDARGGFLIPGLADMHVHVDSVEELAHYLSAGVTTVRVMHGGPQHLEWRAKVASGALVGPTIITAGPPVGQGIFRRDARFVPLQTPADADRVVREQVRAGYDMIKIIQRVNVATYQRLVEAARVAQVPVVGHVVDNIGLDRALVAGQVTLEHANGLRQRSWLARLVGGDDAERLDNDARAIARADAWVGTIVSPRNGLCDPATPTTLRTVAALRRANVKLLAGTDAGIGPVRAGTSLHCELATLVAAGLTPYEALQAATVNAGAFVRLHLRPPHVPFGTVTVGSRADLLLLSRDPRVDIDAITAQIAVMVRGVWRPH